MTKQYGFSLVELIAVMILIGILGASFAGSVVPSASAQLQASRDRVITAFFSAQQLAMVRSDAVRLIISAPDTLDIRIDTDSDGSFADEDSALLGGAQTLVPSPGLISQNIDFNRLGQTAATNLTLTQGSSSVVVAISGNGYAR